MVRSGCLFSHCFLPLRMESQPLDPPSRMGSQRILKDSVVEKLVFCISLLLLCGLCHSISLFGGVERTTQFGHTTTRWSNSGTSAGLCNDLNSLSASKGYALAESSSSFVASIALLKWQDDGRQLSTLSSSNNNNRFCCTKSTLFMGKGDGKKRRKKKSATKPAAVSSDTSKKTPPPQRVSTDINVPVRMQIKYGQMRKERAKQSGTSFRQKKVVRTAFRRKWTEEEIELKREERKRKGQDPDWDVILNRTATMPLVIVDGYNIIHKWPRLKKHMTKGDLQRARQLLVDDLEDLRSLKGWRIEVVFDGMGRNTLGPMGNSGPGKNTPTPRDRATNKDVSKHGVRMVYTGVGVEADSYIEARCAEAKKVTDGEVTGSFIVATDDSMIRMAGLSAGALCMSAGRFVDELKAVKKATSYRVEAAVAKVNGHAIRPEKLRGTNVYSRFGKAQFVIEDKRNRKKKKKKEEEVLDIDLNLDVDEDDDSWWAYHPNQAKS